MRFLDIELEDLDLNDEFSGSFYIPSTDELIDLTDNIRKRLGYTDLVGSGDDNDVYYNFYLIFDTLKEKVKLQASCNHGKEDDWLSYDIQLFPEEEKMLTFKVIEALAKALMEV